MKLKILVAVLIVVLTGGCLFTGSSSKDVISYRHSINSFTAREAVKIGNQTFESHVDFTKPGEIIRKDYVNGSLAQKILIENGTQRIITPTGLSFRIVEEKIFPLMEGYSLLFTISVENLAF